MFATSTGAKALIQRVVFSMAAAAFAFHFFLYGYCLAFRPREATPDMGLDHPFRFADRLVYVDSFESFFLKGFFFWFAVVFIAVVLSRSTVGRVLQYDVLRKKIARAQPGERTEWRPFVVLVGLWLALLVAGWRASL